MLRFAYALSLLAAVGVGAGGAQVWLHAPVPPPQPPLDLSPITTALAEQTKQLEQLRSTLVRQEAERLLERAQVQAADRKVIDDFASLRASHRH